MKEYYKDNNEYIADVLKLIEILICSVLLKKDKHENLRDVSKEIIYYKEKIDKRVLNTQEKGIVLELEKLRSIFNLSDSDIHTICFCYAPEKDIEYGKIFLATNETGRSLYPSVHLIDSLQGELVKSRINIFNSITSDSPLFTNGIIKSLSDKDTPFIHRKIKLTERIVNYLNGNNGLDKEISIFTEMGKTDRELESLVLPEDLSQKTNRLTAYLSENLQYSREQTFLYIHGSKGTGKKQLAESISTELGSPLIVMDMEKALYLGNDFYKDFSSVIRECKLQQSFLMIKNMDELFKDEKEFKPMRLYFFKILNHIKGVTFLSSKEEINLVGKFPSKEFISIKLSLPTYKDSITLWNNILANEEYTIEEDLKIEEIAGRFQLSPGNMIEAINSAKSLALWNNDADKVVISMENLFQGCRLHSNRNLAKLSKNIKPTYKLKDLILNKKEKEILKEIISHVKNRQYVYEELDFGKRFSLGKGCNILFYGDSGTGKTMSAEILATELKLDLYKVNLSTLVSKYIGETEKNLDRIFNEAVNSNAIVFFDEADALFGKRSDVKDARDRYANIEVGYLLQKMEEYSGVTILATNLKGNIDQAFRRRMHFAVDFPRPDKELLLEMWQRAFPDKVELADDVDFNFLVDKFNHLTGANIKSIALNSAFFAAEKREAVNMKHVIYAVEREHRRTQSIYRKDQFGDYFDLVKDRCCYN